MQLQSVALMFCAVVAAGFALNAGNAVQRLPRYDRPMLYARFGIAGELIPVVVAMLGMFGSIASIAWGFLNLNWYMPPLLFLAANFVFINLHNLMTRLSPNVYRDTVFLGLGPFIGIFFLVVSQGALWLSNR